MPAPPRLPATSTPAAAIQQPQSTSFGASMARADNNNTASAELCHHHRHHQQQQQLAENHHIINVPTTADGSLDNIQMIVDEENNTSLSQANDSNFPINSNYIFLTSDEMSTLKPANPRRPSQMISTNEQMSIDSNNKPQLNPQTSMAPSSDNNNSNNNGSSRGSDPANFLRGAEHAVHFDDLNLQEISSEPRVSFTNDRHLGALPSAPSSCADQNENGNGFGNGNESNGGSQAAASTTTNRRRVSNQFRFVYDARKYWPPTALASNCIQLRSSV